MNKTCDEYIFDLLHDVATIDTLKSICDKKDFEDVLDEYFGARVSMSPNEALEKVGLAYFHRKPVASVVRTAVVALNQNRLEMDPWYAINLVRAYHRKFNIAVCEPDDDTLVQVAKNMNEVRKN